MEREQLNVLWDGMEHTLNEMQRRQYAATRSKAYGYGEAVVVHQITGLALNTITRGKKELLHPVEPEPRSVREIGGGPKWTEENYPDIREHIRLIVEDNTYGNSEKIVSWTTDSLRGIERKLAGRRLRTSRSVRYWKTGDTASRRIRRCCRLANHPERNAQFEFINAKAGEFIKAGEPVISVDLKKKENIGNFKNSDKEYRRGSDPRKVLDLRLSDKGTGENCAVWGILPK
jgi:hypothetical protein